MNAEIMEPGTSESDEDDYEARQFSEMMRRGLEARNGRLSRHARMMPDSDDEWAAERASEMTRSKLYGGWNGRPSMAQEGYEDWD